MVTDCTAPLPRTHWREEQASAREALSKAFYVPPTSDGDAPGEPRLGRAGPGPVGPPRVGRAVVRVMKGAGGKESIVAVAAPCAKRRTPRQRRPPVTLPGVPEEPASPSVNGSESRSAICAAGRCSLSASGHDALRGLQDAVCTVSAEENAAAKRLRTNMAGLSICSESSAEPDAALGTAATAPVLALCNPPELSRISTESTRRAGPPSTPPGSGPGLQTPSGPWQAAAMDLAPSLASPRLLGSAAEGPATPSPRHPPCPPVVLQHSPVSPTASDRLQGSSPEAPGAQRRPLLARWRSTSLSPRSPDAPSPKKQAQGHVQRAVQRIAAALCLGRCDGARTHRRC